MGKGRLLASVCALGLIVAAPAFAAGPDNPGSSATGAMSGSSMGNSSSASQHSVGAGNDMRNGAARSGSQHAMDNDRGNGSMSGMQNGSGSDHAGAGHMQPSHGAMGQHDWSHGRQAMRRSGSENDTSQNAEVDRLNDRSLQAAKQGQPFMTGNASTPDQRNGGMGGSSGSQTGKTKM